MINLLNQHDISYIIDNSLTPIKHLNMFLYKNLNEILKNKEYIYIPEYNTKIHSVSSDPDFCTLFIKISTGGSHANHSFYSYIPKFQRFIIDEIKEHLSNKIAWED